jgi:hypothetical protein
MRLSSNPSATKKKKEESYSAAHENYMKFKKISVH